MPATFYLHAYAVGCVTEMICVVENAAGQLVMQNKLSQDGALVSACILLAEQQQSSYAVFCDEKHSCLPPGLEKPLKDRSLA